jgi:hypothetical protein
MHSNLIGGPMHLKDASKPDGEACGDDGTLKDASEIKWVHSPSQSHPALHDEKQKWKQNDSTPDSDINSIDVLLKANVSMMLHSFEF